MCLQEKFRFMKVSPDYENFEIMYSPMNGTTTKTVFVIRSIVRTNKITSHVVRLVGVLGKKNLRHQIVLI